MLCTQIAAEKKANKERDADLPPIPGGSLGTFKQGLQSLPLKVTIFFVQHTYLFLPIVVILWHCKTLVLEIAGIFSLLHINLNIFLFVVRISLFFIGSVDFGRQSQTVPQTK